MNRDPKPPGAKPGGRSSAEKAGGTRRLNRKRPDSVRVEPVAGTSIFAPQSPRSPRSPLSSVGPHVSGAQAHGITTSPRGSRNALAPKSPLAKQGGWPGGRDHVRSPRNSLVSPRNGVASPRNGVATPRNGVASPRNGALSRSSCMSGAAGFSVRKDRGNLSELKEDAAKDKQSIHMEQIALQAEAQKEQIAWLEDAIQEDMKSLR